MAVSPKRVTAEGKEERVLSMQDRISTLTTFAREQAGHTFGLDNLVDDVIYAHETGHLPKGKGLDAEPRHFVHLLFVYAREARLHRAKEARITL